MYNEITKYNEIKKWDIIYEECYWTVIKTKVTTKPIIDWDRVNWKAINVKTNNEINYIVTIWMSHYCPNLYTKIE